MDSEMRESVLEADSIYLLLKKDMQISRANRLNWLLEHINQTVTLPLLDENWHWSNSNKNLELISVVPVESSISGWKPEINHLYKYKVTNRTKAWFLAHRYKLTVCLDMSPSMSTVDIQRGEIILDEMLLCFKKSLESLAQPFLVPGSCITIEPSVYLTIIAHTPFFTTPAQQVLIKGVRLSQKNIHIILKTVETQLQVLEEKISQVTAKAHEQIDSERLEFDRHNSNRDIYEDDSLSGEINSQVNIPMVSPDASFINMLRYSMLALSLLPEISLGNILIMTDGVVCMPAVNILESLLQQLHYDSTCVSFIMVGGSYHPHCSFGYVSYKDILYFIAKATLGVYIDNYHESDLIFSSSKSYLKSILLWTFHSKSSHQSDNLIFLNPQQWNTTNTSFHGIKTPPLLLKKQSDEKANVSLALLLSRRLREGYTLDSLLSENGKLEVCLSLPWKTHTYLLYSIISQWPVKQQIVQVQISIKAPYENLHDTTCLLKKQLKSAYRQAVVETFWSTISQLVSADSSIAQHLSSFSNTSTWYTLPEGVRCGMPVFVMLPNIPFDTIKPQFTSNDMASPKFSSFWQPICHLENTHWRKWFHIHRIFIILHHDHPLPRHLQLANPSGRFTMIQCRQAAAALYGMLAEWASFVLIDNHSYIKCVSRSKEKSPTWFCIVRVTSKLPCAVLNIGFMNDTPGEIRKELIENLRNVLSQLTYSVRSSASKTSDKPPSENKENICCTVLNKPLEKILIRYERMPSDLTTIVFPDGTQPKPTYGSYVSSISSSSMIPRSHFSVSFSANPLYATATSSALLTTLSRYLHHRRWVWGVLCPVNPKLGVAALDRILSTITKMRLKEGFTIAHSSAGIINMILEVEMDDPITQNTVNGDDSNVEDENRKSLRCIIQYILFPPHSAINRIIDHSHDFLSNSSGSDIGEVEVETTAEELQLVTEVWIEPQYGQVARCPPERLYMEGQAYQHIADMICEVDSNCITSLLTLEHLSLLCQDMQKFNVSSEVNIASSQQSDIFMKQNYIETNEDVKRQKLEILEELHFLRDNINIKMKPNESEAAIPLIEERIHKIPFSFNLVSILPKCRQAQLLFSLFGEDSQNKNTLKSPNILLLDSMYNHLQKLHDLELCLNMTDSKQLMQILLQRQKLNNNTTGTRWCHKIYEEKNPQVLFPSWRCFIKGVSVTHVMLTFVPCDLADIKSLHSPAFFSDKENTFDPNDDFLKYRCISDEENGFSSNTSLQNLFEDSSKKPKRPSQLFMMKKETPETKKSDVFNIIDLPIFIYDCPLSVLMNAFVNPHSEANSKINTVSDIFEDRTYRNGNVVQENFINIKKNDSLSPISDIYSEDSEETEDHACLKQHCRILGRAHAKCFVLGLFRSLHRKFPVRKVDVQAAIDLCESTIIEIDISDYIKTVCGHVKNKKEIDIKRLLKSSLCVELRYVHRMIKKKFAKTVQEIFQSVPSHENFYYFSPNINLEKMTDVSESDLDSNDDEILEEPTNDLHTPSSDNIMGLMYNIEPEEKASLEDQSVPLFLHFTCSVNELGSVPVKVLPTCLEEIFCDLNCMSVINLADLKVMLNITLSTLPKDVQDLIMETSQGMQSTSYCSLTSLQQSGISSNISSESNIPKIIENSCLSIQLLQYQNSLIMFLKNEIKWQLQDEIVTLLLDSNPVTIETLDIVKDHVSSSLNRQSCHRDVVTLNFVYGPTESMGRFLEEFAKLPVNDYKLCKAESLYYLAKDYPSITSLVNLKRKKLSSSSPESNVTFQVCTIFNHESNIGNNVNENKSPAQIEVENILSDLFISVENHIKQKSLNVNEVTSVLNHVRLSMTDQMIDDELCEDVDWLSDLDRRRPILPNFWMIMNVDNEAVTVYFHCRFLELETTRVSAYLAVQRSVISAIKHLCKQVNQFLLLQYLDTTKTCDKLLEPEEVNHDIWNSQSNTPVITRNTSQVRLKSMDDSTVNENSDMNGQAAYVEASLKFMPGFFACAVIWETHFVLHPRLKTGSVRPGLSRGIHALRTVLNKFSVNNRSNMFVYRDNSMNVFYLRLYENLNTGIKSLNPSQDDSSHALVVRSPSIASLPLRPQRHMLAQADFNSSKGLDIRPRVRSFGEKESQDAAAGNTTGLPPEDTITLKVHGVTAVGRDIMCDLVQVLQNRLDDAVLELLSLMLARNPMCKLTPDDVHFLQKPFRPPENIIKLSIKYSMKYIDSFQYYLQQNLLQFLHIPKYTDTGGHYHFRDYSDGEHSIKRNPERNIYLYNQSPISGSKGIACIAIAITQNVTNNVYITDLVIKKDQFEEIISSDVLKSNCTSSSTVIEFRIWQKGRVNIEVLTSRLRSAVSHATWDLIMEHKLLIEPLCINSSDFNLNMNESIGIVKGSNHIAEKKGIIHTNRSVSSFIVKANKLKMEYQTHSLDGVNKSQSIDKSFSDMEIQNKSTSLGEISINLKEEQMSYHIGELGILHEIYADIMRDWLEFACDVKVPSVTKYKVMLTNRHPVDTTIIEMQRLIKVQNSDIVLKAFAALDVVKSKYIYVPYDLKNPSPNCLLLGRNFEQWWANCLPEKFNSELLEPKSNKVLQKFSPLLIDLDHHKFVPRQRLLLISLTSSEITLYAYNWSKDRLEKIISQIENLGSWLSVRASVLLSVTAQKMGLFHNQPLFRKSLTTNNIYVMNATEPDHLVRFSSVGSASQLKDWSTKRQVSTTISHQINVEEVFRDVPVALIKEKVNYSSDPIIRCSQEIQQLRQHYKRTADEQKRVYSIWQARWVTNQIQLQSHMVQLLCQQSRIIHYCHTPLLLLSRWRVQAAATRDHSLISAEDKTMVVDTSSPDHWHNRLCIGFFEEYKQYLQTLGFSPIQIVASSPGNATSTDSKSPPKFNTSSVNSSNTYSSDTLSTCYLQRSMLGGILLFELLLTEPFFITKLHALECYRIQNKTSRQSINQFTLSFLDECDKVKVLMHLHSFTYDFHLRCIYRYLSDSSELTVRVCQGYHLIHFLDDFMKYYSKAPNFARNLVYAETISVDNLRTPPKDLYLYLLSHEKHYNMNVVSMNLDEISCPDAVTSEFALVQVTSSPQLTYKDSQDRHHTDDFDLTLIVSYVEPERGITVDDNTIYLKYYIILTSRSEIYPKSEVERTLGKFRTVTWTACFSDNFSKIRYTSLNDSEVTASVVQEIIEETAEDDKTEAKLTSSLTDSQTTDIFESEQTNSICSECMGPAVEMEASSKDNSEVPTQTHSHIEIRQESVNYLGYYSSHEQLMQQLILDRAKLAREQITEMVTQGMTHCKTHLLWNKLVSKSESNQLTYDEFMELRNLTKLTKISDIEPQLACLLHNQPISWFHQFTKIILAKYLDQYRIYTSSDGKVQHFVILHPRYLGAFMMVSIDSTTDNGELYAAYREPMRLEPSDMCEDDCKSLIEDFINCICFQIWVGMT